MTHTPTKLRSPPERATALMSEHRGGHTWRDLARRYNLPAGTLCRFANSGGEYVPRRYTAELGIELPIMRPAPVCSQCGQVNVRSRCTQRKPLPAWVDQAVAFLQEREAGKPRGSRVHARGGKVVNP